MVAIVGGCCIGGYHWFQHYQTPTIRDEIAAPLYTVSGPEYAQVLDTGRAPVAFGPLPGSAFYAGGLAFRQPQEAWTWIQEAGKEGWRVYLLSGDYDLDTHYVRGLPHTNKTLLVTAEVTVPRQ
jgi:hypothetical protein